MPARLAIWIVAAFLVAFGPHPARAADMISFSATSIPRGGTGSFTAFTTGTNPFEAATLDILAGTLLLGTVSVGTVTADFQFDYSPTLLSGFTINGPVQGPGTLFTFTFSVPAGAPIGLTTIAVDTDLSAVGIEGELQFFAAGRFTVTAADVPPRTGVPEPASAALFAAGLVAMGVRRRR